MSKVFDVKMTLAIEPHNLPASKIKAMISSLFNVKKQRKTIGQMSFTEMKPENTTDPIAKFLIEKTDFKFYTANAYVLVEASEFADGTKTSPRNLQEALKATLPLISIGDGDISLNINILDISVKKL